MNTDIEFYEKYQPEYNTILLAKHKALESNVAADDIAPFGGCMYETYDEEFEYVNEQVKTNRVWTIIDEGDEMFVVAGLRYINRMGYLVTDKPWENINETYKFD
jgi:hypothetical protein